MKTGRTAKSPPTVRRAALEEDSDAEELVALPEDEPVLPDEVAVAEDDAMETEAGVAKKNVSLSIN